MQLAKTQAFLAAIIERWQRHKSLVFRVRVAVDMDCLSAGILVVDHLCVPVPHMPAAGELILCDALPLSIGGCAANTAIDLAKVGVKVGVAGCVGNDTFGQFVIDTLAGQGVDTIGVRRLPDVATSGTLIINVQGEDRRYIHCAGANAVMTAADIPFNRVAESKIFYVGGYLLMPALEKADGLTAMFRRARDQGIKTVLDVVLPGPGDHWPKLEKLLAETDIFLPNDTEAAAITGSNDPLEQARQFREAGAKTVVITQGSKGTVLVSDSVKLRDGIYPIDFVGGTGSGDAFDAGFIAGLLAGEDPHGCLRWGSALGASCVRSVSATESVFNRAEAQAFMKAHELQIEAI